MVLWSTKNNFCVLFILWGEVTSKEDRKTTNEVELLGCRMVFKLWDSIVAEAFGQSPQPFLQLRLQQQLPQAQ